jgi:hypothetical protein
MRTLVAGLFAGLFLLSAPALAQSEEIMVTGARSRLAVAPAYADAPPRPVSTGSYGVPVITLTRVADNLVQSVRIDSDTREAVARSAEIYDMLAKAIALAEKRGGIVLSVNEAGRLMPLTRANAQQLRLGSGLRADTSQVFFVIKTALGAGGDVKAAQARIASFIKDVPTVGRAVMESNGEPDLSVVNPEQYRPAIIEKIAADANMVVAKMGEGYAVELMGLDRSVQVSRASTTEVSLYLPYSYRVVPKPD